MGVRPYGVTFHVGSQMTDPTAWSAAIARSAALMADLRTDGIRLRMLNLGAASPAGTSATSRG
jgi:ornithine decarboxylase